MDNSSQWRPSTKDVRTLGKGGGGGGSGNSGKMRREGGGWLAKCGRPLGKKFIATFICEIYSDSLAVCLYIKFSFCLYSKGNMRNPM